MKKIKHLASVFSLVLFLLPVLAEANSAMPINLRSFWVSPGISLSGAFGTGNGGNHFQFGGEVSAFYFGGLPFYGIYADFQYNKDRQYFTLGPEAGVFTGIINGGIDAGILLPASGGDRSPGFSCRLFLSGFMVPVMLYVRYNYFPASHDSLEAGLLLKLPLQVH